MPDGSLNRLNRWWRHLQTAPHGMRWVNCNCIGTAVSYAVSSLSNVLDWWWKVQKAQVLNSYSANTVWQWVINENAVKIKLVLISLVYKKVEMCNACFLRGSSQMKIYIFNVSSVSLFVGIFMYKKTIVILKREIFCFIMNFSTSGCNKNV